MFDVAIVGSGIAGALIAKRLALAGKRVIVLEAGPQLSPERREELNRYFTSSSKIPSSPYLPLVDEEHAIQDPALINSPRPTVRDLHPTAWRDPHRNYLVQNGPLAFPSTFERVVGGTSNSWLGTSLRLVPNDFRVREIYGILCDWPLAYDDMERWYGDAEYELGVSGDVGEQSYLGIEFHDGYQYPMRGVEPSLVDKYIASHLRGFTSDGAILQVRATPAARNTTSYQGRPACTGNSSCIPICPTQAKYDPSVTLKVAVNSGFGEIWSQCVVQNVIVGEDGRIQELRCIRYRDVGGPPCETISIHAKVFVLAGNAIENPKLLLLSKNQGRTPDGVANRSGQVGRNLMDHPLYLAWGLAPREVYPYRGPLATSGIEDLRDGPFRHVRAAFRIEIGNVGWNFPLGDPFTTMLDFVNGLNKSGLNPQRRVLGGHALATTLRDVLTRQFHLSFELEQSPDGNNRVSLAKETDHLGIQRPQVSYDLSDYTRRGLAAAKTLADALFKCIDAAQYTAPSSLDGPTTLEVEADGLPLRLTYRGSGHIAGTHRMGTSPTSSVVDHEQRSWDHSNLFIVGSGTFPTIGTANPTLTIAALSLRTAGAILKLI